eukprot:scaffold316654_cov18-Tisochrysis_lutea.AAC.1
MSSASTEPGTITSTCHASFTTTGYHELAPQQVFVCACKQSVQFGVTCLSCAPQRCVLCPLAAAMMPCPSVTAAMKRHAPCASCHSHALSQCQVCTGG